jgi:hypothetical protein
MTDYYRTSGKVSGVQGYEIGDDYILVKLNSGLYRYSYDICGKTATENTKRFALSSCGLITYIAKKA